MNIKVNILLHFCNIRYSELSINDQLLIKFKNKKGSLNIGAFLFIWVLLAGK